MEVLSVEKWTLRAPAVVAAIAVMITLLAYLPALDSPFFLVDDAVYVTANTTLQQLPLSQLWRIFTSRTNPWEYLPLRDLSYKLDMALFGLHPTGYRVHNCILFALTCWFVWLCVIEILKLFNRGQMRDRGRWVAAATTALFAVHPAHVESVAWISGRKDVLSGCFAMLSLWQFTAALNAGERADRRRMMWSFAAFACAILSKSTVVTVPLVAFLLAFTREYQERFWRATLRSLTQVAPLLFLSLVSVGLQVFASNIFPDESDETKKPFSPRDTPLIATMILGTLNRIAILPVNLRLIYDVMEPGTNIVVSLALGIVAVIVTLAGLWFCIRKKSLTGFAVAIPAILLVPFLQLIPFFTWSLASERFLFLPILGFSLAVAATASRLPRLAAAVLVAVLVALGAMGTASRDRTWSIDRGLLVEAAQRAPKHAIAIRTYLHYVLMPKFQFDEARKAARNVTDPDERRSLLIYADAQEAMRNNDRTRLRALVPYVLKGTPNDDYNMRKEGANMALEAGLFTTAEEVYRGLLREFPNIAEVHYNLGLALNREGRFAEAASEFQSGIDKGFGPAKAWNNLGLAARDAGQLDNAVRAFRGALDADPKYWHAAYNLSRLLWVRGDQSGARDALCVARERAVLAGEPTAPIDNLARQFGQ